MKLPFALLPSRELVEIESDFDLQQSIECLRDETLYEWGSQDLRGELAGQVSADRVVISRRQNGYYLNRLQPVFYGRWKERDGKVFLVGRFGFPYDVWMVLGFILFAFTWLLGLRFWNVMDDNLLLFLFELPGILTIGLFTFSIYAAIRWLVREDETFVRLHIRHALRE